MGRPRLLYNIAALGSVQLANYLLPLITLPYLTRTLGAEAWGKVTFVQLILSYFTLVTNWGFTWSGTRKVAATRENRALLSDLFLSIWLSQLFLALSACLILLFLIKYVPYFSNDAILFLIGIGLIIGNVLFPVWFLNGLEMMTTIAVVQVATKIFAIPLIFTLVRDFNDAPVLLAINSSASITCGVITLVWMKSNLPIFSSVPQLRTIVQELKEGAPVFVSTVAISLYTTLTPAVLGVLAGPTSVGQFLLADRVRQVAQASLSPITHALFPRMSFLFANDPQAARVLTRKSGTVLALLSSICSITIFLGADFIIRVLGGQRFEPAAVVLKWFSPLIFIVAMSNLFGVQILLAQRKYRQVNAVLITAGVGSLIMLKPLITWKGETGAAMNALVVETFVTLAFIVLVFLLRRQPSA